MGRISNARIAMVCISAIIISGSLAGCGPSSKIPTMEPGVSAPAEITRNYSVDNNRTNLNNSGIFAEDNDYFYYKNISDACALYRIDKVSGEKLKLSDTFNNVLSAINVTDDKIYFIGMEPQGTQNIFYSVNKDGTGKTTVLSGIYEGVVNGTYLYYTRQNGQMAQNMYKYNLENGNTETLLEGWILNLTINDAGNKLYYIQMSPIKTVNEYDLNFNEVKVLLTNDKQTGTNLAPVRLLNYYNGSIYYVEETSVKKYDLAKDTIEIISTAPTMVNGRIDSLAVSKVGIFYIASSINQSFLYSGEFNTNPAVVTQILKAGTLRVGILGDHIVITNDADGKAKGFIRLYTIKGEVVPTVF